MDKIKENSIGQLIVILEKDLVDYFEKYKGC